MPPASTDLSAIGDSATGAAAWGSRGVDRTFLSCSDRGNEQKRHCRTTSQPFCTIHSLASSQLDPRKETHVRLSNTMLAQSRGRGQTIPQVRCANGSVQMPWRRYDHLAAELGTAAQPWSGTSAGQAPRLNRGSCSRAAGLSALTAKNVPIHRADQPAAAFVEADRRGTRPDDFGFHGEPARPSGGRAR